MNMALLATLTQFQPLWIDKTGLMPTRTADKLILPRKEEQFTHNTGH